MTTRLARWTAALTLAGWGATFEYFYGSGRLASFIHPRFRPLVLGTGLGLFAVGVVLAFFDDSRPASTPSAGSLPGDPSECLDDCGRTHFTPGIGGWLKLLVLLVPLALAVAISPDEFGSVLVRNRSGSQTEVPRLVVAPTAATAVSSPASAGSAPDKPATSQYLKANASGHLKAELIDLRYAAQSPDLRQDLDGKTLEIVGQWMLLPQENRASFHLTRLFVICCAADAQPINIPVETTGSTVMPRSLSEMAWVTVTGTVRFEHTDRMVSVPVMTATAVQPTAAPKEKYLY